MTPTPNTIEGMAALEKRITELEKAMKTSLKREETLARRLVALEKKLAKLDTAHAMLRSHVGQVAQRSASKT